MNAGMSLLYDNALSFEENTRDNVKNSCVEFCFG